MCLSVLADWNDKKNLGFRTTDTDKLRSVHFMINEFAWVGFVLCRRCNWVVLTIVIVWFGLMILFLLAFCCAGHVQLVGQCIRGGQDDDARRICSVPWIAF